MKHSRIKENIKNRMSDQEYINFLEGGLKEIDERIETFCKEYQTMIGSGNYTLPDLMGIVNKNIPLITLQK